MELAVNMKVQTPIGEGLVVSLYEKPDSHIVLVRMKINKVTQEHTRDMNCVTPNAVFQGLWVFDEKELKLSTGYAAL